MFRELSRKGKKLPKEVCIELLKREKRGVLSVCGDDGYPYGMPMNHWYNEEDGCLYFHCGRGGHRMDALTKDARASFCVYDGGVCGEGDWALLVKSVIVFGTVTVIEDAPQIAEIVTKLSYKFTQDEDYIRREIEGYLSRTVLLKLTPQHVCGKWVKEA